MRSIAGAASTNQHLSRLIEIGSAMSATAASPMTMSPDMLQTQAVRLMALTSAQKKLDLATARAFGTWLALGDWCSRLSAEHASRALYSKEDGITLKTSNRRLEIVRNDLAGCPRRG